jgi:hypothetical protein
MFQAKYDLFQLDKNVNGAVKSNLSVFIFPWTHFAVQEINFMMSIHENSRSLLVSTCTFLQLSSLSKGQGWNPHPNLSRNDLLTVMENDWK